MRVSDKGSQDRFSGQSYDLEHSVSFQCERSHSDLLLAAGKEPADKTLPSSSPLS